MSVILQINFVNAEESTGSTSLEGAYKIAELPGLHWKVWIRNPETHEAGGIYLWDTREQAEAWVAGPTISALRSAPHVSNFSAKYFEVNEAPSRVTRAPLDTPVPVTA